MNLLQIQVPQQYEEKGDVLALRGNCEFFIDSVNLNIDQVQYQSFTREYPDSNYQKNHYTWIRFTIQNNSADRFFLMTIDQWDYASLFVPNGKEWLSYHSGTQIPVELRPETHHRLLSFIVFHAPRNQVTYYLKVRNEGQLKKNYAQLYRFAEKIEFESAPSARRKFMSNAVLISFVIGICFILMVYNFTLFVSNRRINHLILFIYIGVLGLIIANINGIATNYIFPGVQSFEMPLGLVLAHVISILLALYIKSFLQLKGMQWQNILIYVFISFILFSLSVSLFEQKSFWYLPRRIIESSFLLTVILGSLMKREKNVGFLLTAVLCSIIGANISDFMATSSLNIFVRSDAPYLTGVIAQMFLFTMGSSNNVRILENQVKQTLREKQQILEQQNDRLNLLVEERTIKLNELNQSIAQQNEELTKALEELTKAQQRLIESEKMAMVGTLVTGIAHEINNPINIIGGMVGLLKRDLNEFERMIKTENEKDFIELKEEMTHLFDNILASSVKATTIINNLLTIAPEVEVDKSENIDLKEMCESMLFLFEIKHPEIQFQCMMPDIINIYGNKEEIKQVLLNIVRNGVDAINTTEDAFVRMEAVQNSSEIIIKIADNGRGINPQLLNRIFDPFYSTKEPGKGTGLGLFIAKTIINKHNGKIEVKSKLGEGTAFSIRFPRLA